LRTLDDRLNSCSGYRQIGRALSLSYAVLKNRYERLARNYLNVTATAYTNFALPEDIAFDGFESFVGSQFVPDNFNIAVGTSSRVPYVCSLTLFRRHGRMTEKQKEKRKQLDRIWKLPRRSFIESCKEAFRDIISLYLNRPHLTPFTIYTDQKKEYQTALKELPEAKHLIKLKVLVHHQTSSRAARTRRNPLFPVNYFDREIRKNSAAHVRETVRFDREVNMSAARMAIMIGYHTFRKPFTIDGHSHTEDLLTHGDVAGLTGRREVRQAYQELYTHRHVWTHVPVKPKWMEDIWLKKGVNPPVVARKEGMRIKNQPGNGWTANHLLV